MKSRGQLYARLEALEARLISPLDRAIEELNDNDRAEYDAWKQRCSEHYRKYDGEPGNYWRDVLDGKIIRPPLPRRIERQLRTDVPRITVDMSISDAAEVWQEFRGSGT